MTALELALMILSGRMVAPTTPEWETLYNVLPVEYWYDIPRDVEKVNYNEIRYMAEIVIRQQIAELSAIVTELQNAIKPTA